MIIDDAARIRKVVELLGTEQAASILTKSADRPVSVPRLVDELQVPRSTVYRYINDLVEAGLLTQIRSQRTPDGHWFEEYRSLVSEVRLRIAESGVSMELMSATDMVSRFLKLWDHLGRK